MNLWSVAAHGRRNWARIYSPARATTTKARSQRRLRFMRRDAYSAPIGFAFRWKLSVAKLSAWNPLILARVALEQSAQNQNRSNRRQKTKSKPWLRMPERNPIQ